MSDDIFANPPKGPRLRYHAKKKSRAGKGRGKPWATAYDRPTETEKRAGMLLAHPPLRPVRR